MLKLVLIGIWVILVTAGATFAASYLNLSGTEAAGETPDLGVEQLSSELMSIPVVRAGDITGYLVMEVSFAADKALLAEKKVEPVPFLKDAAFRVIFGSEAIDFQRLKKKDIDSLTAAIAAEANLRLGEGMVRHVLLQQLNYVKREEIRTNWIGGAKSAGN